MEIEREIERDVTMSKPYFKCQAQRTRMEIGRLCRYEHEPPYTSHYHVFCAPKRCRPIAVPARIHCSVDTIQCIEI